MTGRAPGPETVMETRLFAAAFVVLTLIFLLVMVPGMQASSAANPMFQTSGIGPAAIPYFAGTAVLILSIAIFFERPAKTPAADEDSAETRRAFGRAGLAVAILLGFLLLMPILGFLVAGIIFLAAFFFIFRAGSPIAAGLTAVVAPTAVDLLLRKVFLIPLPQFGLF